MSYFKIGCKEKEIIEYCRGCCGYTGDTSWYLRKEVIDGLCN